MISKSLHNKSVHDKRQGSALPWGLLLIAGLSLIVWTTTQVVMPRFEKKQRSLVLRALNRVNPDPVSLRLRGFTATLSGEVIDEPTRLAMIDAIGFRTGVFRVDSRLQVMEQEPPPEAPRFDLDGLFSAFTVQPVFAEATQAGVPYRLADEEPDVPPTLSIATVGDILAIDGAPSEDESPAATSEGGRNELSLNVVSNAIRFSDDIQPAPWLSSVEALLPLIASESDTTISDKAELAVIESSAAQDNQTGVQGKAKLRQALDALATLQVRFETNSDVLTPSSTQILNDLAAVLVDLPDIPISIEGHTDSTGDATTNLTLSLARAVSVREYLVSQGVSVLRLQARGFGEQLPIADNVTPQGRATNRRIEFNF